MLSNCVQVAVRFHLLQNLLGYLKEIFKEEIPAKIYIREGQILNAAPEKVLKEKTPDCAFLDALHYANLAPKNPDGNERKYNNKRHDLNSAQYQRHAEGRKKQHLSRDIQCYWKG